MARCTVDNSKEIFGSRTSIADLAVNSLNNHSSDAINIYDADYILMRDWQFELDRVEMEYALGVTAYFRDGSILSIGAWLDGEGRYGDSPSVVRKSEYDEAAARFSGHAQFRANCGAATAVSAA